MKSLCFNLNHWNMLVTVGLINYKSLLLQIMAWCWTVDKPLSNPNKTQLIDECICCSGSMYSITEGLMLFVFITRDSEVIMLSPCVFVCLFVCLCLCHDVCPDDLTMKDCCHTNNILQIHCLVVQVMLHALVTSSDVTRSQSNFEIDISLSIFELVRRSKAQNIGNANGYLSGVFNFQYHFRWKSLSKAQNGGHFDN